MKIKTILAIDWALTVLIAASSFTVGYASRTPDPAQCQRPEPAPMRFCEVLGSPIGSRIATMPDIVVSTDP